MNIEGLDMEQLGLCMSTHVAQHISGYDPTAGASLFQESYLLHYDEAEDMIPEQHRHRFTHSDMFNGASGAIEIGTVEYVVMLLASEDYNRAYFLWVQYEGEQGEEHSVIVKDFLA